jgi:hypothetical protein
MSDRRSQKDRHLNTRHEILLLQRLLQINTSETLSSTNRVSTEYVEDFAVEPTKDYLAVRRHKGVVWCVQIVHRCCVGVMKTGVTASI